MKLLFKQRLFSWLDSYDIYDENEQTVYVVRGQLAIDTASIFLMRQETSLVRSDRSC